jgi:hypothetical protein
MQLRSHLDPLHRLEQREEPRVIDFSWAQGLVGRQQGLDV